jgi:guanylate kinase
MSDSTGMLLVISGPSGVGKSTISHDVVERVGAVFSVSMTTRPKTDKDQEAVDYYFVDDARFDRALADGELLEYAQVFGYRYGTPRTPVEQCLAQGKHVVVEIDVEGAIQVRESFPQALMFFVLPPSLDTLLQRLRHRARDDEATIQRRFHEAQREMDRAKSCGVYDHFIMNDQLENAIEQTVDLIRQRVPA